MPAPDLLHLRNTALAAGLRQLLEGLRDAVAPQQPLYVYLAGGMAVHLYCGTRVTADVDAEFSARVFVPADLVVAVTLEDGRTKALHFDTNYNSTFALMHEDYLRDAVPTDLDWPELKLRVLAPVDLAVSKIARLQDVDKGDIRELVARGWTSAADIEQRATEALGGYVGRIDMLKLNIREAVALARAAQEPA